MNRVEMLLAQLAEECAEVAQRAVKILRFGKDEIQPGETMKNSERLTNEYLDLATIYGMLAKEGVLRPLDKVEDEKYAEEKILKVEKYLKYSAELGILVEVGVPPTTPKEQVNETTETPKTEVIQGATPTV